MNRNPYDTYKQQSVMTMTNGQLLLALYDGFLKQISLTSQAFTSKNCSDINTHLQKAQLILTHLRSTLDFKYEISGNLSALYDYFNTVLIQVNIKKDPTGLEEVYQMISELRDTFEKAEKQTRIQSAAV